MNPFKRSPIYQQRGQSLVELGLLLPLFLAIIFGAVEYSSMFMTALRSSNLSRAAANNAFRDCAFLDGNSLSTCLQGNAQRLEEDAGLILSDFENRGKIIVSVFELDGGPAQLLGQETAGSGNFESRYNSGTIDTVALSQQDRVVIGEIVYPYEPITPISSFLNLLNLRVQIYEVTIY